MKYVLMKRLMDMAANKKHRHFMINNNQKNHGGKHVVNL